MTFFSTVARKVKKLYGYICQARGFNFEVVYTGIPNLKYVEAHHLVPISTLKGQKVNRNPKTEFEGLADFRRQALFLELQLS